MSLRLRFLLSLLAVLLLMAVPALFGVSRVMSLRDLALDLRGQAAQSALAVGRLEAALAQLDHYQRAYVATGDRVHADRAAAALDTAAIALALLRAAGHAELLDPGALRLAPLQLSTAQLVTLVASGQLEAATALLVNDATPAVERARATLPTLAAAIDEKTSASIPAARRSATAAGTATILALLVATALAGALSVAAARVLTVPLDQLRGAMARVADGSFQLPATLDTDRSDEIGDLARSFRTMTVRLAELDRVKAEFVGTAGHGLKTPISVISGYAELMQEELAGSLSLRQRNLLDSLAEQTHELQGRVDQLLEISRMESGRLRLGMEEIDIRHFAEELHRTFAPAASRNTVQLEIRVHDRTPAFLVADPDVLRAEILGNIIGNALKFTPAGGTVSVSFRADMDRLHIDVTDTGRGIAEDQLDRIFEKYYQGRGARGGAGLGLTIAKAAVEAHGGRIDVQSRPGRGTRVRVTLPAPSAAGLPATWNV